MSTIVTGVSTLPTPGHRGAEVRDVFVTKQEAFQDALYETFILEINETVDTTNAVVVEINTTVVDITALKDTVVDTEALMNPHYTAIDTVNTYIDNVNTVATDVVKINAVADNSINVNIVADNIANVVLVGTDITNVNTIVPYLDDMVIAADNVTIINTVAANITSVNTVATDISAVNTNASNIIDIRNVADNVVPYVGEILLADTYAAEALQSANDSATSAGEAAASAQSASDIIADISVAPLWVSGTNYSQYAVVTDPINFKTYKANIALNPSVVTPSSSGDWEDISTGGSASIITTEYTAIEGQTLFAATYALGMIDVHKNGIKLADAEYSAVTGIDITLVVPATAGDIISIVTYNTFEVANTYTISEVDSMLGGAHDNHMGAYVLATNKNQLLCDPVTFDSISLGNGSTLKII